MEIDWQAALTMSRGAVYRYLAPYRQAKHASWLEKWLAAGNKEPNLLDVLIESRILNDNIQSKLVEAFVLRTDRLLLEGYKPNINEETLE
jgi:hypothetical protein